MVTTDASKEGLAAVLDQEDEEGQLRPIAFISRKTKDAESRYSAIHLEILAVVWSIDYFRPYLYGRRFRLQTDQRPLIWLLKQKSPSAHLMRLALKLQEYQFDVIHKPGRTNAVADALSRYPVDFDEEGTPMVELPGMVLLDRNEELLAILPYNRNTKGQINSPQDMARIGRAQQRDAGIRRLIL